MVSKEITFRWSQSAHSYIYLSFSLLEKQYFYSHLTGWMKISEIKHFYKFLVWIKEKEPSWFCRRDPATVCGQRREPGGQASMCILDRATSTLLGFALAIPCAATHPSGQVKFPSQSWDIRNDPLKTCFSFRRVMWIPGSRSTLQCKIKQIPALPKSHKWWALRIAKTEADIHNYLISSITEVLP